MLTKEEILEKSRIENKTRDEMENAVFAKAGLRACAVGGIVCALVIVLEAVFSDQVNFSTWAVYLSMTGTMLLVKYFGLRKKHELVFGVLQLLLAAMFFVMYVVRLVRG